MYILITEVCLLKQQKYNYFKCKNILNFDKFYRLNIMEIQVQVEKIMYGRLGGSVV